MREPLIFIAGKEGSGKTNSLYNVDPKKLMIFTPGKALSFRKEGFTEWNGKNNPEGVVFKMSKIDGFYKNLKFVSDNLPDKKIVVLDDVSHLMRTHVQSNAFRARKDGGEGFARYDDYGALFMNEMINFPMKGFSSNDLRSDLTLIIMFHTRDTDFNGTQGIETVAGKVLDRAKIPSYVNVFLGSKVDPEKPLNDPLRYSLFTHATDEFPYVRTPRGLFDTEKELQIPNDLNLVLERLGQ